MYRQNKKEGIIYGAIVSHHGEPSVLCVIRGYGKIMPEKIKMDRKKIKPIACLLYTSPSPRD